MELVMQFLPENAANLDIQDPRHHPAEVLQGLRHALASGAPAIPEARRPGFFEIYADDHVFYIHLSPVSRRITLLARWACEPELEPVASPD
jgi:hypothetical protein